LRSWLACLLLGLWGCGGPDYGEAFLVPFRAAQRAQSSGRYLEAAEGFADAAGEAQRLKDRDEALFLRARMLERAERWAAARDAYAALETVSPDGPRAARAAYDAATLEIEHGEAEQGWAMRERAITTHPDHGSARRALELWAEYTAKRHGESALQKKLASWKELHGTELSQRVHYERARSLERQGKTSGAIAAYLETARIRPYPRGNLTDDAFWHAARLLEEEGRYEAAIGHLREMLDDRESSVGGSYTRPRFPGAQVRIGEIYRDGLKDPARARDAFRKARTGYPDSIVADDAAWQEALMASGFDDHVGSCVAARALRDDHPESRYRRCLHLVCPKLPPEDRPCARYIVEAMPKAP